MTPQKRFFFSYSPLKADTKHIKELAILGDNLRVKSGSQLSVSALIICHMPVSNR